MHTCPQGSERNIVNIGNGSLVMLAIVVKR